MQQLKFIEDSGDLKNINEKYLKEGWTIKNFIPCTASCRFPVGFVLIESPVKERLNELIDTLKKTTADENNSNLKTVIDSLFS